MARTLNKLTAVEVKALGPGRHSDGGGLYLDKDGDGRSRWIFMWKRDGKRREMGLGSADPKTGVGLADARTARDKAKAVVASGGDPIEARKAVVAAGKSPAAARAIEETAATTGDTFGEVAESMIASLEEGWVNEKHRQQWRNSLKTYCKPIWNMHVGEIRTEHVLMCLKPIWSTKHETADRVRGRIERVIDAAVVLEKRSPDLKNPAVWKGHLAHILPQKQKLTRGHHAAMPYAEVPALMAELRSRPALAARALEMTVLHALRTGSVVGARRVEFDLTAQTWTIPAERMKGKKGHKRPHTVVLVGRSLEIARELCKGKGPDAVVFALSTSAMEMLMRRMGFGDRVQGRGRKRIVGEKPDYTVHGFRSSFKDFCSNETDFPDEISEEALSHVVGSKVRRAYRRGEALEKRRALMGVWDQFCGSGASEERTEAA